MARKKQNLHSPVTGLNICAFSTRTLKTNYPFIKIKFKYYMEINVSTLKEKVVMSSKIEKTIFKGVYKLIKLSVKTEKTDLRERQK